MRFLIAVLTLVSLISCGSRNLDEEKAALLNNSALYDPSSVTLIDGQVYKFKEGRLKGRGQKFYSQAAFTRVATK